MKSLYKVTLITLFSIALVACSKQAEQEVMLHQVVKIEHGDECHLCGMLISNFSRPKGELFRKDVTQAGSN